jgi:hypothetical protein
MKTIVGNQSNYIPWKGYFDLIHDADLFFFYDDVQYTKEDWRNRNKIKTSKCLEWISVPVGSSRNRLICEVEMKDSRWQTEHWNKLKQNYGKCAHFASYRPFFEDFYLGRTWSNLSEMNQFLIRHIAGEFLNIKTEFDDSRNYSLVGKNQDRVIDILKKLGAECYITGPAGKAYLDPSQFEEAGIKELVFKDYSGYPEYPQCFPPFQHTVSILDLLFNVGSSAPWYIWGWRETPVPA